MKITTSHFEAFLKCPTLCWLRFTGEIPTGNAYAEWAQSQNESYRIEAAKRLLAHLPTEEWATAPASATLKTASWRFATAIPASITPGNRSNDKAPTTPPEKDKSYRPAATMETCLPAVERIPSAGRGQPAQFVPIHFLYRNKLTKDDKLLLAFDAFVFSEMLGRAVSSGKIIHGDDGDCARSCPVSEAQTKETGSASPKSENSQSLLTSAATVNAVDELRNGISATPDQARPRVTKVKTAALADEVRKRLGKIITLLASSTPPDLVLNRYCAECEFQARCRKIAVEKDDLSLLASMSAKERQKLRSKGIFTVTQLSSTFRPRRRPKRQRDKREKYHHALKALAIREQKIHIVGSPELKIEGTPVYLDVEGLPDRDFYYLIGMRIGQGDSAVQHSLWADTVADEGKIWREFLTLLETVEKPILIHYGSYETNFLKAMKERYGSSHDESVTAKAIVAATNIVTVMFAKIYFPTFSNRLKEIGCWLGFTWSETKAAGLHAILWRHSWETLKDTISREQLICYNAEDCSVLEIVVKALSVKGDEQPKASANTPHNEVVSVDLLKSLETMWPKFKSPFSELEQVNKAARWDYQRDRVYVRSSQRIRRIVERQRRIKPRLAQITRIIQIPKPDYCPFCIGTAIRQMKATKRVLHDVQLIKYGLRRICYEYHFAVLWCSKCQSSFGVPASFWPKSKYGRNLVAYLLYQLIELSIPMNVVGASLNRIMGFNLTQPKIHNLKRSAARYYQEVQEVILKNLCKGRMVHVDETRVSVKGKTGCVWVITNLHEVAYLYTDAREGEFVQNLLTDFSGVLISDFFTAYDSIDCPQQKCLIHLVRDLNTEVLNQPYDHELKEIVKAFAELLKAMIETVDRYGLKKHFLKKHRSHVDRFYCRLNKTVWRSDASIKCQQRFLKNRDGLFTFLDYDGVPWNNNNAEHAIKAFARLRDVIQGSCTPSAVQEYLILLSVCQTCKYMGVDFLDFLRSGEKDIHAFAESRQRKRSASNNPPTDSTSKLSPDILPPGEGQSTQKRTQPQSIFPRRNLAGKPQCGA